MKHFSNHLLILTLFFSSLFCSVEHKEAFIDNYLKNISSNMSEKTHLLQYIKENPKGTFIDIGTGGDAIGFIASNLPSNIRPTLIAADIDPLVLSSIQKRRPEIEKHLFSKTGPKVELVTMSAVQMNKIKDSTISGISASALAHEIFSYVPIQQPIDRFVSEVCRVLEKDGVMVYRDPKWVDDPKTISTLILKRDIAKYYTTLFLTRFLDREFSKIKDYQGKCSKPTIHNPNHIYIYLHLKNRDKPEKLSFDQFVKMSTTSIDFEKDLLIEAPKGFLAEIQRHYLMYLRDYFSVGFFSDDLLSSDVEIDGLTPDLKEISYELFPKNEKRIQKEDLACLQKEKTLLKSYFEKGVIIDLKKHKEIGPIASKHLANGMDRNLMYTIDSSTLVIDPKLLTLFFQDKNSGIFKHLSEDNIIPFNILEHLRLEGEEHYFYKTKDQLITYIGRYSKFCLEDTHKQGHILAPICAKSIHEAPRDFYKATLKRDMPILDRLGREQEAVTEKNIIHFQLQPIETALQTYKELIETNKYPRLKKWIDSFDKFHS